MDRGADIVVKAGQGEILGPASPSWSVMSFVHLHRQPGPGEGDGRREAVGAGSDDDGVRRLHSSSTVASAPTAQPNVGPPLPGTAPDPSGADGPPLRKLLRLRVRNSGRREDGHPPGGGVRATVDAGACPARR